jgi:hypothetical protein
MTDLLQFLKPKLTKVVAYRRIQRFMADFDLPKEFIARLIFNLLSLKGRRILAIDSTKSGASPVDFGKSNINSLMLGDYFFVPFVYYLQRTYAHHTYKQNFLSIYWPKFK